MSKESVKDQLAELRDEATEELGDLPTREERAEAIKWLGYEWDGILKFLKHLDAKTEIVIPDEIRAAYQQELYELKLEGVKRKQSTNDLGLFRPIR